MLQIHESSASSPFNRMKNLFFNLSYKKLNYVRTSLYSKALISCLSAQLCGLRKMFLKYGIHKCRQTRARTHALFLSREKKSLGFNGRIRARHPDVWNRSRERERRSLYVQLFFFSQSLFLSRSRCCCCWPQNVWKKMLLLLLLPRSYKAVRHQFLSLSKKTLAYSCI